MRGIQQHLGEFEAHRIRVVAISVDLPEASRRLCDKRGYTYLFLSDPKAEAIRRYDLLHVQQGPGEHEIARPAEFLIDSSGTVRWLNLTENYWVRSTPEQMLQAASLIQ